jgi:hypothetical protein
MMTFEQVRLAKGEWWRRSIGFGRAEPFPVKLGTTTVSGGAAAHCCQPSRECVTEADERVAIAADGVEMTVWMGATLDVSTHNGGIALPLAMGGQRT